MTHPPGSSSDSTPGSSSRNDRSTGGLLGSLLVFDRLLGWLERTLIAAAILFMALLMSAHVVGNILFNQGIAGTYEITEMLIVVITFVGVGYAARHARHISMSAIYDQLGGRARKALMIFICLGTALLMFYFCYKSVDYVMALQQRGRTSASLQIPLWMVYTALPIGFALAGIQYVLTAIRNLISPGVWRSLTEAETYSDVPPGDTSQADAPQVDDSKSDVGSAGER